MTGETICEGALVRLRSVRPDDADRIAGWKQDPLLREMALDETVVYTPEGEREDIERALGRPDSEAYVVIVVTDTDRPVGYIRINWMDGERQGAWLRFALGEQRGKGYMKDALRAFLGHLFEGGAHRVDAEVYEINEVSLGLLRSLGFVVEGRKREACRAGGRWLDMHVLGLLERDFAGD